MGQGVLGGGSGTRASPAASGPSLSGYSPQECGALMCEVPHAGACWEAFLRTEVLPQPAGHKECKNSKEERNQAK